VAVAALRTLHVDTLLLGVHGVTEHAGLTTPNILEGETSRALVESARRVVVTADHTKWGVVGLSTIAGLDRVDVLVTDSGISAEARRSLEQAVGQLVVADVAAPPRPADDQEQDAS
jgi:DeoR/GlpR family transcriptional regulator of sugar metabolism